MKWRSIILSVLLVALIASASAYGVYIATYTPPDYNHDTSDDTFTPVTIQDCRGVNLTFNQPVKRIVCITSGYTELLCGIGAQDLIVGRDSYSETPYSLSSVPIVASSSYNPTVE